MTEDPVRDATDSVRDANERAERAPGRPGPLARVLLLPVRAYRVAISPLLPPSCRFYPSCSAYAVEALTVHGALRGTGLAAMRLLRCGPWHPGGLDPVPPAGARRRRANPAEPARASQTPVEE